MRSALINVMLTLGLDFPESLKLFIARVSGVDRKKKHRRVLGRDLEESDYHPFQNRIVCIAQSYPKNNNKNNNNNNNSASPG